MSDSKTDPTHTRYIDDVVGPENTKKIYNEFSGMCCEGHVETYFVTENGQKHGPHVWEYGYERTIHYYDNGTLIKTEEYIQSKESKFTLVRIY